MTTTDEHMLLMSRFLEGELNDAEEQELFRLLGESVDAREMFAAMRKVQSALAAPIPVETMMVPAVTDKKFSFLFPGASPVTTVKRAPVSSPTLLLSLIGSALVIMMFLLTSVNTSDVRNGQRVDSPTQMYAPGTPMLPR